MLITEIEQTQDLYSFDDNKYLIVGLGNIGKQYDNTRHNAGFILVDSFVKENNLPEFKEEKKFSSLISSGYVNNKKFYIAKPTTFMNLSGEAVKALVKYYDLNLEHVYIAHDDLDIDLGKSKVQFGKGPREHNGVNSVEQYLGTDKFWHIRIGVENRDSELRKKFKGKDYVLSQISKQEKSIFISTISQIIQKIS